jgi:hypothetical protein
MTASEMSAAVQAMLDRGLAVPVQANVKAGYIHFEFLGGIYDGCRLRLYPPFTERVTFNGETYVWGPPKNRRSARRTYRLEE